MSTSKRSVFGYPTKSVGSSSRSLPKPIIKLKSTAGTGYQYVTTKNKVNSRERIELMKYDPKARKHVIFKEEK